MQYTVIESHSENTVSLRIDKPFPALVDFARSIDFEKLDAMEHRHVPFVVILVRVMEDWKALVCLK